MCRMIGVRPVNRLLDWLEPGTFACFDRQPSFCAKFLGGLAELPLAILHSTHMLITTFGNKDALHIDAGKLKSRR
jgi:hypothetical protein